jgi:transposase
MPPIRSEVRRTIEAEEFAESVAAAEAEKIRRGEPGGAPPSPSPEDQLQARRKRARAASEPERAKRRALRKNLPVVTEQVAVRPEQLPTGYALTDFRRLGDGEVVRRVDHVREHLVVVEYVLEKLASKDGAHVITAETPTAVASGGQYGPGLYAHVATAKCADSLPLYRISTSLERAGFPVARSTLCDLFHRSAELLSPPHVRLLKIAAADPYLNMDETPQPVLDEKRCRRGYMWTIVSQQVIGFRFSPTRAGETATSLLGETGGWLQTDAFSGYDASTTKPGGRKSVGCWAHARRYYFTALTTAPEAREMLELIVELYRVEYEVAEADLLGSEAHRLLRVEKSGPILKRIAEWKAAHQGATPPKSPLGKAITYMTNQWKPLNRFLEDPKLRLDNNLAENALRIIALGRKNFLFVGHDEAGQNLAVLQTLVSTCRLHRVNPYDYLSDVLIRISDPRDKVDDLLPFNWQARTAD